MQYFKPKKYLSQNFLKDPKIVQKIIRHAKLKSSDLVVEVGPGLGVLTRALASKAKHVIAIEIDNSLIPILKKSLAGIRNVEIIKGDALKFTPPDTPYKFVSNIPYSISSPLLDHFIKDQFMSNAPRPPETAILMLQKEVAEKLCSKPPDMNVLALHIQPFGQARVLSIVRRTCFTPQPKVDSAIVRIELFEKPKVKDLDIYLKLVHAGFSQKRKQLLNSLCGAILEKEKRNLILKTAKINPCRRAETLSIYEWEKLARSLKETPQLELF